MPKSATLWNSVVDVAAILAVAYIVAGMIGHQHVDKITVSPDRTILLNAGQLPYYYKYKETILTPVRDQSHCSSCWAFSITGVMADTLSIKSGGKFRQHLSPQYLLSCTYAQFGCKQGASPEDQYNLAALTQAGVPLETDYPYVHEVTVCKPLSDGITRIRTIANTQKDLCIDPDTALPGFRQRIIDRNILNMKHALIQYGPICGTLRISKLLYEYSGTSIFYDDLSYPTLGGHVS